ncbi:MAG TPA: NAD(P)H-dependent oxidoreductase subunit E, partial [Myxococcales bacterium]
MIALSRQAGVVPSPFDAEQQRRFDEGFEKAVAKYPPDRRRSALLAALHLAQDELGWLSEPAMAYVGFRLDVPPVRVREVATFYTMYRLHPVGQHHIGVCNSVSCWAMGSEKIL